MTPLHNDSSIHLAPYIVITILLSIFIMLYLISPWPFCNYLLVLPNPLLFFSQPPNLLPSGNRQFVLHIHEFVLFCLFCFLDSKYKWNHIVFYFLCLISLSIIPSCPSMMLQMVRFHSFLWLSNIPLHTCITAFLIHLSTDGLLGCPSWLL